MRAPVTKPRRRVNAGEPAGKRQRKEQREGNEGGQHRFGDAQPRSGVQPLAAEGVDDADAAHHGAAACRYHKTTLRYFRSVPLHEVCAGSISGPKAVLGSVFVADAVDAIPATVSWIVDRLAAQMSSSPLTRILNSLACKVTLSSSSSTTIMDDVSLFL